MTGIEQLSPLLGAIESAGQWLKASSIDHVVVGGVAASILGRPRVTRDVDVLVDVNEEDWESLLNSGSEWGILPRISDCIQFAHESRMLLVRHEASSIDIDIIFASLSYEREIIERATSSLLGEISVLIPTPEDLIVMKAVAQRPRDCVDIEATLDEHPDVDWDYILKWGHEFANALDASDIVTTLERFRKG